MSDLAPVMLVVGDYTVRRGRDDQSQRDDAVDNLKRNGCRDWRFEPQPDGTLIVHGYLRDGTARYL